MASAPFVWASRSDGLTVASPGSYALGDRFAGTHRGRPGSWADRDPSCTRPALGASEPDLDPNPQELRQHLDDAKLGGRDRRVGTCPFPGPGDIAAMQALGLQDADAPVRRELPESAHLGSGDDAVLEDTIEKGQVRHGRILISGNPERDADPRT